jgi:hypothetical protein
MNSSPSERLTPQLPPPNPVTTGRHRRQLFRQVTLPVLLAMAGFLGLTVLAWLATAPQARLWSDVSLVFLAVLLSIFLILGVLIVAALSFVLLFLNRRLPPYTRLLQDYSEVARRTARVYSDKAVEPILKTQGFTASARALKRRLSRGGGQASSNQPHE